MGNQNQIFKGEHPAQRQFVPYVDGELTQRETTAFGPHLEACWACRLRIGRIQESIASFMEFDEALAAVRFPSSEIRASFRSKLTARVEQRRPKPGLWDSIKSIQRFWAFSAGRIAAASLAGLLIVAILYQFVVTPTVSASELLEKASIARREDLRALASPVMYQKLKVSERDRSTEFEVWSDVESSRAKHAVDNRTEVMRDY